MVDIPILFDVQCKYVDPKSILELYDRIGEKDDVRYKGLVSAIDKTIYRLSHSILGFLLPVRIKCFTATICGRIIGIVLVRESSYGTTIEGMIVDPDYRRCGVASRIYDYLKVFYNRIDLMVYVSNKKAIKFYKKNGFKSGKRILCMFWEDEEYRW